MDLIFSVYYKNKKNKEIKNNEKNNFNNFNEINYEIKNKENEINIL